MLTPYMKNYILRFRASDKDIFDALISGQKKVETRAASVRYKNMSVNDMVTLVCGESKKTKRIKKVKIYKSLDALLRAYKVSDIAPSLKTKAELQALYASFTGYIEKIKQFGFLAIELE